LGGGGVDVVAATDCAYGLFLGDLVQDEACILDGGLVQMQHARGIDHQQPIPVWFDTQVQTYPPAALITPFVGV
jgi:hypothetical protein